MRKITLDADCELVEVHAYKNDVKVDYSRISFDQFISKAGDAYHVNKLSDYSNELFINFFIRKKEWQALVFDDDNLTPATGKSIVHLLWNDLIEERDNQINKCHYHWLVLSWLKLIIACLACFFIVIARKLGNRPTKVPKGKLAIVRSNATYSKLKSISDVFHLTLISEDLAYRNKNIASLFSFVSFNQCLKVMIKSIKPIINDFASLAKELRENFGFKFTNQILYYYAPRVVLKCFFEQALEEILKNSSVSEVFTGNKEDRFAMVEKKLCSRFSIPLTCIPHGLEYAYRFPGGVAGDVFYCTSYESKVVLSKIYPEVKFIFDESLQHTMYSFGEGLPSKFIGNRNIIFFTESRDVNINRKIIDDLNSLEIDFSVRLHPKDNFNNYSDKKVQFHDDYETAIKSSICICRKSTVLIEAIHNNSIAISYLIDSKDCFYVSQVFPSLNSSKIFKCHDIKKLEELIFTL